ncbi:SgcJ/EcaC family oxidoreductase [Nocardia suismassiliense]|uniref:SgcJ/EcaC family oxidoreductase n=1 Tax=Nocardia suismassiliense TaxID=2077092 RepID=UPI000D1F1B43|nr:SgcJ/EcaC family oxidoreductase [Nocardia suismassiliense]
MHDDTEAIRELFGRYTELWVQHEMREWGELFTEDCDFITHRGVWWRSREENVRGHEDVPESVLAQKKNYSQTIIDIQPLTPGVMLVHTEWVWPDHVLPGAAVSEDRRGLITAVLVQRSGRWLIRAVQNTRLNGLDDFAPIASESPAPVDED